MLAFLLFGEGQTGLQDQNRKMYSQTRTEDTPTTRRNNIKIIIIVNIISPENVLVPIVRKLGKQ